MNPAHRYKELQLPQLRSFCLAAIDGNFTLAAHALGLSATTVWQQVRALERQLKAQLLRRRGRAVELTAEGRALLELVQPHVSGLDSLGRLFEARRGKLSPEIIVASGTHLSAFHLPGPIQQFRRAFPAAQVTLRISNWSGLRRLIEREGADVAVLAVDADQPRSPQLEYEHLFDERLTLMTPAGHPLARARLVSPEMMVEYPLILPPAGGADRRTIDRFFRRHDLDGQVRPALVCGLVEVVKEYVRRKVGIALMYVADDDEWVVPGLCRRVVAGEVERLPIEMAVRRGAHLPEHVQQFRRIVREYFATRYGLGNGEPARRKRGVRCRESAE
jgi:DNA-binding transcriptional LysR family regulator